MEVARLEDYLELGLLHSLALLGDIGNCVALVESESIVRSVEIAANAERLRSVILPAIPITSPVDLHSICAADQLQQERLIKALSRRRPQVVVAEFDMLRQLENLFGNCPQPDEQLIVRDVYARMDEIVGKAFSFVDEASFLLVAIPSRQASEPAAREQMAGTLFSSRPLPLRGEGQVSTAQLVLDLLGSVSRGT